MYSERKYCVGKKTEINGTTVNSYSNPYEYSANQNERSFGMVRPLSRIESACGVTRSPKQDMCCNGIRNVTLESPLLQGELGRTPRKSEVSQYDLTQFHFNYLPWNPQNVAHIVWADNMPQPGYNTRIDRLNMK
jgi:hypothetical protein